MNCYVRKLNVESGTGQGDWADGLGGSLAFTLWTRDEEAISFALLDCNRCYRTPRLSREMR